MVGQRDYTSEPPPCQEGAQNLPDAIGTAFYFPVHSHPIFLIYTAFVPR